MAPTLAELGGLVDAVVYVLSCPDHFPFQRSPLARGGADARGLHHARLRAAIQSGGVASPAWSPW